MKIYLRVVLLFACSFFILNCGKNTFNKDDIKGILIKPLDSAAEKRIKLMPNTTVNLLTSTEKAQISQDVFDHFYLNMDHMRMAKLVCHTNALGQAKQQCEESREQCIDELSKHQAEDFKKRFKDNEVRIKDFVSNSQVLPKLFIEVFKVINQSLELALNLDCGDSREKQQAAEKDFESKLAQQYSPTDIQQIKKLFMALDSLIK